MQSAKHAHCIMSHRHLAAGQMGITLDDEPTPERQDVCSSEELAVCCCIRCETDYYALHNYCETEHWQSKPHICKNDSFLRPPSPPHEFKMRTATWREHDLKILAPQAPESTDMSREPECDCIEGQSERDIPAGACGSMVSNPNRSKYPRIPRHFRGSASQVRESAKIY